MIDDNCDNSESANSEFFSIDHHAACTRRDSWPESRHETVRVLRFVVCFFHIVALPALEKQCTFAGCIVSVSHRSSVDLHSRKYPDTGNAPPHSPVFGGTPAGLCAPCTECVFLIRVGQRVCALSPMVWLPGRRHLTRVPVLSAVLVAVVEGLPAPARVRARMSEYYMNHGRDGSMQRACAVERAWYVPPRQLTHTACVCQVGGQRQITACPERRLAWLWAWARWEIVTQETPTVCEGRQQRGPWYTAWRLAAVPAATEAAM